MKLRPILKKNLTIRSSDTGRKADIIEALDLCASGKVTPIVQITSLADLNNSLDKIKAGETVGKLVVDLSLNTSLG